MAHPRKRAPSAKGKGDHEQFLKRCPVCQTELRSGHVEVLAHIRERQFIHATCPECAHALLFFQVSAPGGTGLMGMVTDLSAHDVRQVAGSGPFSEDDVIDFHTLLRQNHLETILTRATRG